MANTIKLKRASGSDPGNSDLAAGELAIRTSNCKLFSKNDSGSAIGIVAGSADTLTTARTIAGVSFDGSANISLNNNAITNGAGYITSTLTEEQVEDFVGGMVTGNTETGITVTYQDSDGTLDFVVASQTDNNFTNADHSKLDGIEASATADQTASEIVALIADQTIAPSEIRLADNEKLYLGASTDLQLFHDPSVGNIIQNGFAVLIIKDTTGTIGAKFANSGSVELNHNGSKKFETVSGGISLTGGAAANITALSDGSTITVNMATASHHSVTLGGNRTFAAPSNQAVGQSGSIFITQDGTGSRTASFNSAFKFVGGTAPTLSTAANAVDRIDYVIKSSNVIHCVISLDVK